MFVLPQKSPCEYVTTEHVLQASFWQWFIVNRYEEMFCEQSVTVMIIILHTYVFYINCQVGKLNLSFGLIYFAKL